MQEGGGEGGGVVYNPKHLTGSTCLLTAQCVYTDQYQIAAGVVVVKHLH